MSARKKSSNIKLIHSPDKISHKFCKMAPIFTTFTQNTSLDSLK